jgi:putative ABC transport system substrate-binding protein
MLVVPRAAAAQTPAKVPRIGVLSPGSPPPGPDPNLDAFRQGLRDLGYVEGQHILLEYRYADWQPERLPALAAELVQRNPDVIFTFTTPGVLAAKQATATIPIVMAVGGDPIGSGFVASLARPGGNITGLSNLAEDLVAKLLELLKEAVPGVSRVAVLSNPANPAHAAFRQVIQSAARTMGVTLLSVDARGPHEFDGALPR